LDPKANGEQGSKGQATWQVLVGEHSVSKDKPLFIPKAKGL
jgi:hypothetical protein